MQTNVFATGFAKLKLQGGQLNMYLYHNNNPISVSKQHKTLTADKDF